MNARVLLILSICINAALGGYIIFKGSKSTAPAETVAKATDAVASRRSAQSGKTVTVTVPSTTSLDWRVVESEDYKKYIANLRASGCPEETIRDIIVADVNKLFEARKKELSGSSTNKFQ